MRTQPEDDAGLEPTPNTASTAIPASDLSDGVTCPACLECCLSLQQPDAGDTDRLLGICLRCKAWHILEVDGDWVRITTLP